MDVRSFTVGPVQENSYLFRRERSDRALIDRSIDKCRAALKDAMAERWEEEPGEAARDLWPRMRARLEAPAPRPSPFDWALAAVVAVAAIGFPELVLGVLYHL